MTTTEQFPRVTPEDVEANVEGQVYLHGPDLYELAKRTQPDLSEQVLESLKTLTIGVRYAKNGFGFVTSSAPVSPGNYVAEKGEELVRNKAIEQMWPVMGYTLCEDLMRAREFSAGNPFEENGPLDLETDEMA